MAKAVLDLPFIPVFPMSLNRIQGCKTISGFAGRLKLVFPFSTLRKSTIPAITKFRSGSHLHMIGYLFIEVWPFFTKNFLFLSRSRNSQVLIWLEDFR